MQLKTTVNMKSKDELLAKYNLEPGGKVQQVIDKSVIDQCEPYCPMLSGTLAKSAYGATHIGSGEVIYPGPYAHYQYYGEVYGPNIPIKDDNTGEITGYFSRPGIKKTPTGKSLTYRADYNPLAGSFWFERAKADHLDDIVREAQNATKG